MQVYVPCLYPTKALSLTDTGFTQSLWCWLSGCWEHSSCNGTHYGKSIFNVSDSLQRFCETVLVGRVDILRKALVLALILGTKWPSHLSIKMQEAHKIKQELQARECTGLIRTLNLDLLSSCFVLLCQCMDVLMQEEFWHGVLQSYLSHWLRFISSPSGMVTPMMEERYQA